MKEGALLISNGSGHNPLVVTNSADIDKAVEAAIHLKSLNGGQDCAGPDAILVQESVAKEFTQKFQARYAATKTGSFSDPEVRIGPIERASELQKFADVFQKNKDHIISGGTIDFERGIVAPTIIKRPIQESPNFREMFGPVAFIHTYKEDKDLAHYFEDTEGRYQANRMYVSLFGKSDYTEARDDAKNPGKRGNIGIVLRNKTIHEDEIGYKPYGGYSLGASAIWRKTPEGVEKAAMPTLIPEIIDRYLIRKEPFPKAAAEHQPKQKEINPVIEGFQAITKEVFGNNLAFGFFAKDASQPAAITAFICLKEEDQEATRSYQDRMRALLGRFGMADKSRSIIVPEAELATLPQVTIRDTPNAKDLEVVATILALTGEKEGFIGNGREMSAIIKQVQPRVINWKQQVVGNESSEQTPNQVMSAWLASHYKQQQMRA
jgi:lysyl-tRNA synthetase class 1